MVSDGPDTPVESSAHLLKRAQGGDLSAVDALMARYLPRLRRWASGRLPRWARDVVDTQDLVQNTLLQTFKGINRFEVRGDGALNAYLRQGVMNGIKDELRRASRRPVGVALDSQAPAAGPSPLDEAIGTEAVERYEMALKQLHAGDREAVIARIELGFTHEEVAKLLGKPSANAARMTVERALVRLAAKMRNLEAGESQARSPNPKKR
jgi:RNA polymerase sigma factor (sigma-70 family)